jgi:hypothetical protein
MTTDLKDAVGVHQDKPCKNYPADVQLVKKLLNACAKQIGLAKPLDVNNPYCGDSTRKAIEAFQRLVMRKGPPYGRILPLAMGGITLKALFKATTVKSFTKYQIAPSVRAALQQATVRWPKRSRASDGTLGDAAHAARQSDHNPDADGVVHAFDLTHDPADGVDCETLATLLVQRRDKRVKYIIWNRRICNSNTWTWRAYGGKNPHTKHMHVSIHDTYAAETDESPWWD